MSNKGVLESDITTGISSRMGVQRKKTHRVIQAWHGKHFADKGWAPTSLLVFLTELGILKRLKVGEALTSFGKQTDVWLSKGPLRLLAAIFSPEDTDARDAPIYLIFMLKRFQPEDVVRAATDSLFIR